jgi:hypothetical protein
MSFIDVDVSMLVVSIFCCWNFLVLQVNWTVRRSVCYLLTLSGNSSKSFHS